MNICEPAIRRPIGTALLAFGLLLVGAVAYRFLPVASMPTVDFPTISVSASRPGADPETMAATVAAPLERRLGEIPGLTEMTSRSSLGSSRISCSSILTATSTAPRATCRGRSTPRSSTCRATCSRGRRSARRTQPPPDHDPGADLDHGAAERHVRTPPTA